MNKEIGKILKIAKKKFLVVSQLEDAGDNYLYLMSINQPIEVIIAKAIKRSFKVTEVEIINEKKARDNLHRLFLEKYN